MQCLIACLAGFPQRGKLNARHAALRLAWAGILLLLWLVAGWANAQTLTTLLSFNGTNGMEPWTDLTLSGATLYGTTYQGGTNNEGTVFSIAASGGSPTTLCSFNGSNGEYPEAGVTLNGSTLYGTTAIGGANNEGTVFSIAASGGSPTVLCSFNGSNGALPSAGVTLYGSTLYGTTAVGGANNDGTVFSIATSGGSPTTLCSFSGGVGNASPQASLTLNSSTLYGTTQSGGPNGKYGTVFSIATSGGSPTTLCSFNGSNGQWPLAGLTLNGSTLYGTTVDGGPNNDGTVFSIATSGGSPTTLCSFNGSDGNYPQGGLALVGSRLFGTTEFGDLGQGEIQNSGFGVIYSIPVTGGTPTVVVAFNGSNGASPCAGLTLYGSTLYGTTWGGGANYDGTVFALNVAPATIGLRNVSNATVISGGTATVGMTVSNSATSGYSLNYSFGAVVQSGSATLGAITSGTGSLAPSGSQSCTVSAASTNLGINTISLTASDPNSSNLSQTTTATLTVLSHAAPSLAVSNGNNQMVVVGGAIGIVLSNGTLNQSGLASLDVNSLGMGVNGPTGGALVASGSAQSYTATAIAGAFGPQVETFSLNVGDDQTLSGASAPTNISTSAALTVFDHSNASLSSTATQTAQTINFGSVLRGAIIPSQSFTIYNQAANTTAAYTANLKLTGYTASGDAALTTNLSTFNGLAAGSGTTCTASLNTANYTTTGITTITLPAAQLADDSSLPGAGNNNNGAITVTLQGNVGNATADSSNSRSAFGTPLTATVAQNASYANLESTVKSTTGSGGAGMEGSTATILAGTASIATNVSMAWRTATTNEGLVSDVVDLSGIGIVDGQTNNGSVHTDTFVLQMTYDPAAIEARTGLSEPAAALAQLIQMDYLDQGPDNQWEPAVLGNFDSDNDDFVGVEPWNCDTTLGDWGVNTANHTVWAVLDHNSEFAVVPEPSTLALLGLGAIVLIGHRWRRRLAKGTTQAEQQDDGPAILRFPSQASQAHAARRAA